MEESKPTQRGAPDAPPIFDAGEEVQHYKSGRKGLVIWADPGDSCSVYIEFNDGSFQHRWATAFETGY